MNFHKFLKKTDSFEFERIFFSRWKIGKSNPYNFPNQNNSLIAFSGSHLQDGRCETIFWIFFPLKNSGTVLKLFTKS